MSNAAAVVVPAKTVAVPDENVATQLVSPAAIDSIETEYPLGPDIDLSTRYGDENFNAWFPQVEDYVESMSDECKRFATKHADASKLYNKRYQMITIGLIAIPLFSGLVSILPFSEIILRISFGIFSLVSAALGGLNKTMRFEEKSHVHRKASDKYSDLESAFSEQLLYPFKYRENGILFVKWGKKQYFKLRALVPYPDKKMSRQLQPTVNDPSNRPVIDLRPPTHIVIDPQTGQPVQEIPLIEDQNPTDPNVPPIPLVPLEPSEPTLTPQQIQARREKEYQLRRANRRPILFNTDHDRP